MDRLLTDKEIIALVDAPPTETELYFARIVRRAQDVRTLKAVVEWIESHEKSLCMDCLCAFDFREDEWEAKLKEWGIDE